MNPSLIEEKKLWKKGYKRVAGLDESGRGPLAGPVVAAAVMIKNPKFQVPNHKQISMTKIQLGYPASPLCKRLGLRQNSKQKSFSYLKIGIWNLEFGISKLRDSKKLSPKQREKFYKLITKNPGIEWGIGKVSEKVIDKINIKNAAELAMEKALKNLEKKINPVRSPIDRRLWRLTSNRLKKKSEFLIIDGNHIKNLQLTTYNSKLIVRADEKVFSCAAASILAKVWRDRIMKRYHKKYPQYRFDLHKGYPTKLHLQLLKKYGPCKIYRKSFLPVRMCQTI